MSEWQTIETAPRNGDLILLTDGNIVSVGWYSALYEDRNHPWRFIDSDAEFNGWRDGKYGPTHWMSLPEPPEDT